VRLTIAELRALIAEGLDDLPSRSQVESQLQNAKFDKDAGAKVLSLLDRRLPSGAKLHLQALARALQMWQADKTGWNAVSSALDKVYAAQEPRRASYTSMRAVRPSERPSARPKVA
jgi:hypothetical protein